MNSDLVGRVRNAKLSKSKALMPLFEAVVNSIDAIAERGAVGGRIRITIKRDPVLDLESIHGNTKADINGFIIEDNGIGFTEKNYTSFETMDSQAKALTGGKGVGRIIWLKAFDKVTVRSTYKEGGQWFSRAFDFVPTSEGIVNHAKSALNGDGGHGHTTSVELSGFKGIYRDAAPKSADAISHKLIEHCLAFFLLGGGPALFVEDPTEGTALDLTKVFNDELQPKSKQRDLTIDGHDYLIRDILLRPSAGTQHTLNLCAHNRVVTEILLSSHIPHLDQPLVSDEGVPRIYAGYVSGSFLDERVDADRTGFEISLDGRLDFDGSETIEAIEGAAIQAVKSFLGPFTETLRQKSLERVTKFIEDLAPRYRPLLGHKEARLETLSSSMTDQKLDIELHRMYTDWRQEARQEVAKSLSEMPDDVSGFGEYKEKFRQAVGTIQEVAKSDLAEYVLHRATVLSFYEKLLGKNATGDFELEEALHTLFFPMRKTSSEVDYDDHNLWLLDERLVYHQYLASDIPFNKQEGAPVIVEGAERADIVIYNSPIAFSAGDHPVASIAVIEFKRPERAGYSDEASPVRQVLGYIDQIRNGSARRPDGSTIEGIDENVPFFCYVVATLTPKLIEQLTKYQDFRRGPDGLSFYHYYDKLAAYIEVMSFRKVLEDARKRNQRFLDELKIQVIRNKDIPQDPM